MALGATPWQVLRLLLAESVGVVAFGLAIGMLRAGGAARLIGSMLYGISGTHPATYGLVLVAVGTVATVASFLPARRALAVNPLAALRQE